MQLLKYLCQLNKTIQQYSKSTTMSDTIKNIISESVSVKNKILQDEALLSVLNETIEIITTAFKNGNKVLFCGNGGSAADAQHLAAEFSGRFYIDRDALYAEALHCNTSYITAVANDYSYDVIYSRLVKGMGNKGDVLVGTLSTSGNSKNVSLQLLKLQPKKKE